MDIDDGIPLVSGVPRPNDFSNLPNYFIQKASIIAFSHVRDEYGLVPLKLRQFLLDLLKYNDNTGNEVCLRYYAHIKNANTIFSSRIITMSQP